MRTPRPMTATLVALGLTLAACGGATEPTGDAGSPSPTSTTPATTAPPATTTAPTTTIAPTTTTVGVEQELEQALDAYWAGYQRCGEDPANCDLSYLAEQGPIREISEAAFAELAMRGWYFSPDRRDSYFVIEQANVRGDEATIVTCTFDAGIVLGAPLPDGQPTVVNDTEVSYRYEYSLYREGTWRVGQALEVDNLGDGDQCAG